MWVAVAMCSVPFFWLAVMALGPKLSLRLGSIRARGGDPRAGADVARPSVSVVIAARDEEAAIGARIDNLFDLERPAGGLEVVVVSDGSTDATVAEVRAARERGPEGVQVKLLPLLQSIGKEAALARAFDIAEGDIVALTDATTRWQPDTLARLVSALQRPGVGAASGRVCYEPAEGGAAAAFAGYQRYVVAQRASGREAGLQVSTSGACSAVWRGCLEGYDPTLNSDLQVPLLAAERGLRTAYVGGAVAWEAPRVSRDAELKARTRIIRLSLLSLPKVSRRAWRARQPAFLLRLAVLKATRWTLWLPTLLGAVGGCLLVAQGPELLALSAATGLAALSLLAVQCWRSLSASAAPRGRWRQLSLIAYGLLGVIASGLASLAVLRGDRRMAWVPDRDPTPSSDDVAAPETGSFEDTGPHPTLGGC